jgi:hypothetical protein
MIVAKGNGRRFLLFGCAPSLFLSSFAFRFVLAVLRRKYGDGATNNGASTIYGRIAVIRKHKLVNALSSFSLSVVCCVAFLHVWQQPTTQLGTTFDGQKSGRSLKRQGGLPAEVFFLSSLLILGAAPPSFPRPPVPSSPLAPWRNAEKARVIALNVPWSQPKERIKPIRSSSLEKSGPIAKLPHKRVFWVVPSPLSISRHHLAPFPLALPHSSFPPIVSILPSLSQHSSTKRKAHCFLFFFGPIPPSHLFISLLL